ncbi:hypothetical protein [Streptomyces sp. NPDC003006]
MSTHRRHPSLRAAAVSALVGGALLVPAAGAFADSPPSPEPKTEVYDVALGDGAKAEVRHRGGSYAATLSVEGRQIATLSVKHPTVTEGGVRYELYPSNGHIGITHLKGEAPKGGSEAVTPRGGVKAGAEGVRSGGDPVFLVAGGGMAAAGAAGLGFAMLRRGRTDS